MNLRELSHYVKFIVRDLVELGRSKMNEKELSQYYWLNKEVKQLENRIIEFGDGVGAIKVKDDISTNHPSVVSIQERKIDLVNQLIQAKLNAIEKYLEIERYIETVEDSEIRQLMRYRYLYLYDWFTIGEEMGCDRTTASKKLRKFIKKNKNSHNSHLKNK